MTSYIIEKGVPLPTISGHAVRRKAWDDTLAQAFWRMEEGDSILTKKTLQAISAAALRSKTNVTSRREGDFYRVWKLADASRTGKDADQ